MNKEDNIVKYTGFCEEETWDCALCLKKCWEYSDWQNGWNTLFGC